MTAFFQLNMISTIFMTSMTFTNSHMPRPLQVSWKQNQVDYKKLQQQQQKMRKIGFLSYFHIMQILHYYDWIITTKKIVIVMRIYIRFKTNKKLQSPPKQASKLLSYQSQFIVIIEIPSEKEKIIFASITTIQLHYYITLIKKHIDE